MVLYLGLSLILSTKMNHQFTKNTKFTDSLERQLFQYTSETHGLPETPLLPALIHMLKQLALRIAQRNVVYRPY